jgi:hypothetical protein
MYVLTNSTGMERLSRDIGRYLLPILNDQIAAATSLWAPEDATFAAEFNKPYVPVVLEEMKPENYHFGHIPSLIEAPLDKYPNIAIMCAEMSSVPDSFDQGDEFSFNTFIEIMVKSVTTQEDVNSRIQRTTDAVHSLLLGDRSIGGRVTMFELTSGVISDVFKRKEAKSRGADWFWQGSRLEYTTRIPATY